MKPLSMFFREGGGLAVLDRLAALFKRSFEEKT